MKVTFKDQVILETELFEVGQDWEVPIPGFFIIRAKRKMRSFFDFTSEESLEFMKILIQIRKGMKESLGINDIYFFQNEDTEHGFHFWMFPRLEWMEKFGRKIQSVRPIMEFAKENMFTEDSISQVKEYVKKMKLYLNK